MNYKCDFCLNSLVDMLSFNLIGAYDQRTSRFDVRTEGLNFILSALLGNNKFMERLSSVSNESLPLVQ